jgi:MFS family permease
VDIEHAVNTGSLAARKHPLRNGAFRRWLIGSTISLLGDQFYLVALPWLVLDKLGSAATLGSLMMAGAVPRAALLLVGGVMTDRFSARWVMLITAVIRALCVMFSGLLAAHGHLHLAQLTLLVVIFGVADAFAMPAQSAYLPWLLRSDQMVAGTGLSQTAALLGSILGPLAAGVVIAKLGVASAFYVDAVSFLFVIVVLLRLPDPRRAAPHVHPLEAMKQGFSYVLADAPLRSMMLLAMAVNLCVTGPLAVGIADLVKTQLGSASAYGVLMSAAAVGGLTGALLAGVWKIQKRGLLVLGGSAALSMCLVGIGLHPTGIYWLAAALVLIGCIAGLVNVHIGAWVMQRIDPAVRGRVSSVLILGSLGVAPISMGLAGVALLVNVSALFLMAGGALFCISAIAALRPPIRKIC